MEVSKSWYPTTDRSLPQQSLMQFFKAWDSVARAFHKLFGNFLETSYFEQLFSCWATFHILSNVLHFELLSLLLVFLLSSFGFFFLWNIRSLCIILWNIMFKRATMLVNYESILLNIDFRRSVVKSSQPVRGCLRISNIKLKYISLYL